MSRAYRFPSIVCEVCHRNRRSTVRNRNICRRCNEAQSSVKCHRCKQMKHFVDETSGLCPRCTTVMDRPVATCSRCSHPKPIYNLEKQLCDRCNKLARKKETQIRAQCSICGQVRSVQLRRKVICKSCYMEKQNGQGNCLCCNKFKVIQVKKMRLCKLCYRNYLAPDVLKRYVRQFITPYTYNKKLFDMFVTTIKWETVEEKMHQRIRIFGCFLQMQQLSELLTWEIVESILPSLGPTNRNKPKQIRSCLLQIAHMLAMEGKLESWKSYVDRRSVPLSINVAPEHIRELLHHYVAWLRERKSAHSNIRVHVEELSSFWWWCKARGIYLPEQVQAPLVSDYLLSLYWQWQCSACHKIMLFDPSNRKAPETCAHCDTVNSLTQEKRYVQNTVRGHRSVLFVFFSWLKMSRRIVANPVQRKTPAPEPTIQHYSSEVIKGLCVYIRAPDADPTEALILYLIIFHALSVWELRHAILPNIIPLRQGIVTPSLAETYYIIVPRPVPSLGDHTPGRPDIRLDFPPAAASWLKPLLLRFEQKRQEIADVAKNQYVLLTTKAVRQNTAVSHVFVWKKVRNASRHFLNAACNPNTLRKTAGVMLADRGGAALLHWMGWEEQQAFSYSYVTREIVHPRPLDVPEKRQQNENTKPVIFPSPQES